MDARLMKVRNWKNRCLACGLEFTYADGFDCAAQPGRHTVESKEYYHLGAGHIQNIRERRKFSPTLNLKSDMEVRDKITGQISRVEGVLVHFREGGKYETSDPQEQYYLDMHPAVMSGKEGMDAWDRMYLTQDQQTQKAQSQLQELQRQIRDSNALLDRVKSKGEKDGVAVR